MNEYVTIKVHKDKYTTLRMHALVRGITMQEMLNLAVQEWIDQAPEYEVVPKNPK